MRGLSNLKDYQNFHGDVLCISETWTTSNVTNLANFKNWYPTCSPATKSKTFGRASGGLLTLCKNKSSTIIEITDNWIFNKYQSDHISLIIGSIYLKPDQKNLNSVLHQLQITLNIIFAQASDAIILGGDFNARIGDPLPEDEKLFEGTTLNSRRNFCDHITNHQGKTLLDFVNSNGFILLNGRTASDELGGFTFRSAMGKSTIDLIWINTLSINLIKDVRIEHIISNSDHLPITVTLFSNISSTPDISEDTLHTHRLKWSPALADIYRENLQNSHLISLDFTMSSVNTLHENFCKAVTATACSLGMRKKNAQSSNGYKSKPWYDLECKTKKREVTLLLEYCKKEHPASPLWNIFSQKKRNTFH